MMPRPLPALDDQLPEQMSSLSTRIRDGEPSALAEVYNRYSSQLMALAWRLTGSVEDAEDVLHDVFLGLPEALRHYDERGAFEQWIRRVTARVALSAIRARRTSRELSIDDYPSIESTDQADSAAGSSQSKPAASTPGGSIATITCEPRISSTLSDFRRSCFRADPFAVRRPAS